MVGVVVAIEHATYEVRDQVLTLRALLLELAQHVHVKLPLLHRCSQLWVFFDPALIPPEGSNLLLSQRLKLLVEIDAPSGEADHFVASWLM